MKCKERVRRIIIRYKSCDGVSIVEEKVDSVEFHAVRDPFGVELICQRSRDNPHFDQMAEKWQE